MKARIEMVLMKATRPRVVQVLLFVLTLTLLLLSQTQIAAACPLSQDGGCSGG